MMRLGLTLLLVVGGLVGCGTLQTGAQLVEDGRIALERTNVCCRSLETAARRPLPAGPVVVEIDAAAQAFNFGGNKAFFVLYELPPFTQAYSIAITSNPGGSLNDSAIFIPRVAMYDDQFNVVRFFDEKTLRNRGNTLERTVFINPANKDERYLAVYGSDLSASIERSYSMVTVTPVVAGPFVFNMYGGHDAKSTLRSSPLGRLNVEVLGLVAPPSKAVAK